MNSNQELKHWKHNESKIWKITVKKKENKMAKPKKEAPAVVTVDDVEYKHEDLNDEQKVIYAHIADLQRKSNTTRFNLDQLKVGLDAFGEMLVKSLKNGNDKVENGKDDEN